MLKGIDPVISPDLLKILAEMGHGDEIVLADAHFPGHTFCPKNVLRGDGLQIPDLLNGIIPLFGGRFMENGRSMVLKLISGGLVGHC